jgi:hypothetical protein
MMMIMAAAAAIMVRASHHDGREEFSVLGVAVWIL